jgi:chromosome segregation ATPase
MAEDKTGDLSDIARLKSYKLDPLWEMLKEMNVQEQIIDSLRQQVSEGISHGARIEELRGKIDKLQDVVAAIENQLKGLGERTDDSLETEMSTLKSKLEASNRQISTLQNAFGQIDLSEIQIALRENERRMGDLTERLGKTAKKPGSLPLLLIILLAIALGLGSLFQYRSARGMGEEIRQLKATTAEDKAMFDQRLNDVTALYNEVKNSGSTVNSDTPRIASIEQDLKSRQRELRGMGTHISALQDVIERLESTLEMTQEKISSQERRLNNIDGGIAELIQMSDDQSKQVYEVSSDMEKLKKIVKRLDAVSSEHSVILQRSER